MVLKCAEKLIFVLTEQDCSKKVLERFENPNKTRKEKGIPCKMTSIKVYETNTTRLLVVKNESEWKEGAYYNANIARRRASS